MKKRTRTFQAVFLLTAVFQALPLSACFADTAVVHPNNESGQTGALDTKGLGPEKEKMQNSYDTNRITEASEKRDAAAASPAKRNSSQRPSDWIEDTPLKPSS